MADLGFFVYRMKFRHTEYRDGRSKRIECIEGTNKLRAMGHETDAARADGDSGEAPKIRHAELVSASTGYRAEEGHPTEKLAAIGAVDSEPNIRNKLSWGKFTAVFLIQCLEAGAQEQSL